METVLQVVEVVALIGLTALCFYMIAALTSLRRDVSEFVKNSKPVLENLAFITDRLKSTAQKIDDHVDIVRGSLNSLKSVADNVLRLEERVQEQLEEPILQIASVIGALVSGIGSLIGRYRSRS